MITIHNYYCGFEIDSGIRSKTTSPPIREWCGGGVFQTKFSGGAGNAKAVPLACPQTHASRNAQRGLATLLRSQGPVGIYDDASRRSTLPQINPSH